MSEFAEFIITDGTEIVDLLRNFNVMEWRVSYPEFEGGGVYQSTPFADRSRLVHANFTNTVQTVQLALSSLTTDGLIRDLQRLARMVKEKAPNYWQSDRFDDPVWAQVRMKGETETRYSLIVKGGLAQDGEPFSPSTFTISNLINSGLSFSFEHQMWHKEKPGEFTTFPIISIGNYDKWEDRFIPDTNGKAFVGNVYSGQKRLTGVYIASDVNPASVGSNLIGDWGSGTFPADAVVLGTETGPGECTYFVFSNPVPGIIFSIYTAADYGGTAAWEYWDGSSWSAFTNQTDNTFYLQVDGINGLGFDIPSDWTSRTIGATSGYAIRLNTTTCSSVTSAAVAGAELPWFPYTSYVEVLGANSNGILGVPVVFGDIVARALIKLVNETGDDDDARFISRILVALRSFEAGNIPIAYTGFLNAVQALNPNNSEYDFFMETADGDVTLNQAAPLDSPAGNVWEWTPATARSLNGPFVMAIFETVNTFMRGRHRVFARVRQVGGTAGDFNISLGYMGARIISSATPINSTQQFGPVSLSTVDTWETVEIGVFDLMPGVYGDQQVRYIAFVFDAECVEAGGGQLEFSDLWIIPTDEWHGEFTVQVDNALVSLQGSDPLNNTLRIDSVENPKVEIRSYVGSEVENIPAVGVPWKCAVPRHALLQPRTPQRLFFWFMTNEGSGDPIKAPLGPILGVELGGLEQYLTGIGEGL